ncbi:hypothetical protein QJU11_09920 [Pasteurella atlantica]|uniref:hypothetical protein n=1 Tax=Phocoenobacter atlanticus TaxID=3416742 RepID=UPI00274D87B8|nr:hypothetical protein [Pasteurella atlantica]MDP8042507.1 hypothetical protein [Pasteurella atlantica]
MKTINKIISTIFICYILFSLFQTIHRINNVREKTVSECESELKQVFTTLLMNIYYIPRSKSDIWGEFIELKQNENNTVLIISKSCYMNIGKYAEQNNIKLHYSTNYVSLTFAYTYE